MLLIDDFAFHIHIHIHVHVHVYGIEEHLLQGVDAPSLVVVGMEGFWGFLLTAFVALPIAYILPGEEGQGLHEDFIDSLILW